MLAADLEGYRGVRNRALKRFRPNPGPRGAYLAARIIALAPAPTADLDRALDWANQAVAAESRAHHLHTLGLVHYRAGRFDEAVHSLTQSMEREPGWPAHVLDWLLLAMAHHRLGHADEARQWFAKAVEWTDAHAGKVPNEIGFGTVLWGWHDEGARRLLQREADELLHGPPTDRPAPPPK